MKKGGNLMNAGGGRPHAFIGFECLEILIKHKAQVYEIDSQKVLIY